MSWILEPDLVVSPPLESFFLSFSSFLPFSSFSSFLESFSSSDAVGSDEEPASSSAEALAVAPSVGVWGPSCSSQADSPTAMARAAATERTLTVERMGVPFWCAANTEIMRCPRILHHGERTWGSPPHLPRLRRTPVVPVLTGQSATNRGRPGGLRGSSLPHAPGRRQKSQSSSWVASAVPMT